MRDYQRRGDDGQRLDDDVYRRALWTIKGYYRMKEDAEAILHESPGPPDGMPGPTNNISDPNASKAIKREELVRQTDAIDKALLIVPVEYRKGVWQNILYHSPYPLGAGTATYGRWRIRFIREVVRLLNIV